MIDFSIADVTMPTFRLISRSDDSEITSNVIMLQIYYSKNPIDFFFNN